MQCNTTFHSTVVLISTILNAVFRISLTTSHDIPLNEMRINVSTSDRWPTSFEKDLLHRILINLEVFFGTSRGLSSQSTDYTAKRPVQLVICVQLMAQ